MNIPSFLKTLTSEAGVYRYFNEKDDIIYVGKAKNLKKRVSSYFNRIHEDAKTTALVADIRRIEITITPSESEALILESTLIKRHKPKYNIYFKDDKSYPYLYLSTQDAFPKLIAYRGARKKTGKTFGPYPTMAATQKTLKLLQRIFPIRNCSESFFKNRSRPCLQYQIKRCSGPCCGLVDAALYQQDVAAVKCFLEGKDQQLIQTLIDRMEAASSQMAFEQAALIRDQIAGLKKLQEEQTVFSHRRASCDVISVEFDQGVFCVAILFIRQGRLLGSRVFFPKLGQQETASAVLGAFVSHFYTMGQGAGDLPQEVILSEAIDSEWLSAIASQTQFKHQVRSIRLKWLAMAKLNAQQSLKSHLASKESYNARLVALEAFLALDHIDYFECFDISHSLGENTVGSCVVFDREGANKSYYRRYNIKGIEAGDDYAAIEQAVTRHFARLIKEGAKRPSVLFIDGGKGQLAKAENALNALGVTDVLICGVSKGPQRNAGLEQLWISGEPEPKTLPIDNPALHLIQAIRDEAHRFAITGHRNQRAKGRLRSPLESLPGLGPKRRQLLLNHFGSLQGIKDASVAELSKVPGLSTRLAETIHAWAKSH